MKTMLLAFLILSGFSLAPAWAANEAACNSLGAACVCSHTFQSPITLINASDNSFQWMQENDLAGKRCGEGLGTNSSPMSTVTTGTASRLLSPVPGLPVGLNALKLDNRSGRGIKLQTYEIRDFTAAMPTPQTYNGRVGVRIYVYYSPNYQSTHYEGGQCTNDKQTRLGDYMTAYHYGWSNSSTTASVGPGPEQLRGKWVRIEYYNRGDWQNLSGYDFYWKNITDNGPEHYREFPARIGAFSAANPCENPNDVNSCHYPSNKYPWVIDGYREGNCAGYRLYAYSMLAHWNTNTGQRIPPAQEIEGGNLPPPDVAAPSTPLGLKISSLWDQMLTLLGKNG